ILLPAPRSSPFPYTTLFRSRAVGGVGLIYGNRARRDSDQAGTRMRVPAGVSSRGKRVLDDIDVRISLHLRLEVPTHTVETRCTRSEEHTSELQSRFDLVCRL